MSERGQTHGPADSMVGGDVDTATESTEVTDPEPKTPDVVELRVHGVSGTPPEAMLDDPYPRQVAGDDTGRIFRRREPITVEGHTRDVEAYHWGRYTAGSPTKALWLLLLPFAVVNLARFALLLPSDKQTAATERRGHHKVADALLRLLGLVLTLTLVVTVCYLAWEVVARQCAGSRCAGQSNGMAWYGKRSPGIRVLIAALAPAAVVALVWTFGRRPALAEPPGNPTKPWEGNGRVGDPAFWRGAASAPAQRAAHVWASCAVIGLLALATVGRPREVLGRMPGWADGLYIFLAASCIVGAAVALEVLIHDRKPAQIEPDPHGRDTLRLPRFHAILRWAMTAVAAACTIFAWRAIDTPGRREPGASGIFAHAAGLVGAAAGVLLIILFGLTFFMATRLEDSRRLRRGGVGTTASVPPAFRPYWHGMGSWMLASLAVTVSFGFSTAAVFWVAGLLGNPVANAAVVVPVKNSTGGAPIEVAAAYWTAAAVWGGLVVVAGVCLLPMAAWLLRRRPVFVSVLVALAVALSLVGASRGGKDVVSSNAEWFLPAGLALVVAALLIVVAHDGKDLTRLVRKDYERMSGAEVEQTVAGDGEEPAMPDDDEKPQKSAESKVVRAWRIAMARYRYHHAIGLVASLGGLATIVWAVFVFRQWLFADADPLPKSWNAPLNSLTSLGVLAVTALAGWLFALGVATWRSPKMRSTVGILWDLVSFWPRVAHPLCPLPYGGRAVRAVARRTSELANDNLSEDEQGKTVRPYGTVVVSGHSQGTVIAEAACAVLGEMASGDPTSDPWLLPDKAHQALRKTCLVTYGSQLQFIYARLFPSYFGFALQQEMFQRVLDTRWRSLYRWTDPLGGPVLSWPYRDGKVPAPNRYGPTVELWSTMTCRDSTCEGHAPVGVNAPEFRGLKYRRWSIGPDIRLRDPGLVADSAFAARLPPRGHSGYPGDPGFDAVVASLAAGSDPLPPCSPPTGDVPEQRGYARRPAAE